MMGRDLVISMLMHDYKVKTLEELVIAQNSEIVRLKRRKLIGLVGIDMGKGPDETVYSCKHGTSNKPCEEGCNV